MGEETASCVGLQRRESEPSESESVLEDRARTSHVHLEPFHHQVAGQSLVFRYDASTICKSLIPRELHVYKTLPDIIKPHVPEYRGVVDIPLDGSRSDSGEEGGGGEEGAKHPLTTQRLLNKVAKSDEQDNVYHFILLENLVADYQRPCLLDLKLGTRQHGDSAPPDKVQYQVRKCRSTTSALLGVRLCGMKVYQCETEDYVQLDKAEGRRMREDDFREAMYQFLFNGRDVRRDLIPPLLRRLESLKAAISQLPTYRFYSSSLLIVYDGVEQTSHCGYGSSHRTGGEIRPNDRGRDDREPESVASPCCENHRFDAGQDALSPRQTVADEEGAQCCSTQESSRRVRSASHHTNGHRRISPRDHPNNSPLGVASGHGLVPDRYSHAVPLSEQTQEHLTGTVDGAVPEVQVNRNVPPSVDSARDLQTEPSQTLDLSHHQNAPTEPNDEYVQGCSSQKSDRGRPSAPTEMQDGSGAQNRCSGTPDGSNLSASTEPRDGGIQNCLAVQKMSGMDDGELSAVSTSLPSSCCCSRSKVDVRLVDFAHTTHAGFLQDEVLHEGVDHGCLLGLQTLIDTFTRIYVDSTFREEK